MGITFGDDLIESLNQVAAHKKGTQRRPSSACGRGARRAWSAY